MVGDNTIFGKAISRTLNNRANGDSRLMANWFWVFISTWTNDVKWANRLRRLAQRVYSATGAGFEGRNYLAAWTALANLLAAFLADMLEL